MEQLGRIMGLSINKIIEYRNEFSKNNRNRDFFVFFFRRKLVSKRFAKVNQLIEEIKAWKVVFDLEYVILQARPEHDEIILSWVNSYKNYYEKALEHMTVVEELQEIYAQKMSEKIDTAEVIIDKLKSLSTLEEACNVLAEEYNRNLEIFVDSLDLD